MNSVLGLGASAAVMAAFVATHCAVVCSCLSGEARSSVFGVVFLFGAVKRQERRM